MKNPDWTERFPCAITVADAEGKILSLNERAAKTFEKDGGEALVGRSLYDCHKKESQLKIKEILKTGKPNAYTIEKNGVKKLIYQAPWYDGEKIGGIVELSIPIPFDMPHFVRNP